MPGAWFQPVQQVMKTKIAFWWQQASFYPHPRGFSNPPPKRKQGCKAKFSKEQCQKNLNQRQPLASNTTLASFFFFAEQMKLKFMPWVVHSPSHKYPPQKILPTNWRFPSRDYPRPRGRGVLPTHPAAKGGGPRDPFFWGSGVVHILGGYLHLGVGQIVCLHIWSYVL